jgi:hypothetical protein
MVFVLHVFKHYKQLEACALAEGIQCYNISWHKEGGNAYRFIFLGQEAYMPPLSVVSEIYVRFYDNSALNIEDKFI